MKIKRPNNRDLYKIALELLIKDIEKFEEDIREEIERGETEYDGIVSKRTVKAIKEVFGSKYKFE